MSQVSQNITDGRMWISAEGKWCKKCPSCNREIVGKDGSVTTKFNVSHSIIKGQVCHSCVKVGKPTWSSLNKDEMSKRHRGKKHPMYGKHHTDEMKKKQAERNFGKKLSNETKRKLRLLTISQHKKNGISFPSIDAGATEYFDNMNLHNGFHIQHPNVEISELGYFVDGYDKELHAIFEYDTKSHNSGRYKKKDLERQQEIIRYYKNAGTPLNAFYRINCTGVGEAGMWNVLETNRG